MNKPFAAIIATTAWAAVFTQLWINLNSGVAPTGEILIRFISYFTVLTNIAVAVCCTMLLIKPGISFFTKPKTVTAVAVYIAIVGIVYNTVLRWLWAPVGLQKIVDELLHVGVPVLFVLFWIFYVNKNNLQWKDALQWVWFPLLYCLFILIRGAASGFYPYPFMDAKELGYNKVLINSAAVCSAFLFVSFLLIAVGRRMDKNKYAAN